MRSEGTLRIVLLAWAVGVSLLYAARFALLAARRLGWIP